MKYKLCSILAPYLESGVYIDGRRGAHALYKPEPRDVTVPLFIGSIRFEDRLKLYSAVSYWKSAERGTKLEVARGGIRPPLATSEGKSERQP